MPDDTPVANPGWLKPIQGSKTDVHGQALKVMASKLNTVYESHEGATGILAAATNINTVFSTLFSTVKIAYRVIIRTDATITVRFNSATNHAITVDANTVFDADFVEVSSVFVTAAASANIKVILV